MSDRYMVRGRGRSVNFYPLPPLPPGVPRPPSPGVVNGVGSVSPGSVARTLEDMTLERDNGSRSSEEEIPNGYQWLPGIRKGPNSIQDAGSRPGSTSSMNSLQPIYGRGRGIGSRPESTSSNNSWQPPSGHGRGSGCGSGSRPGSTSSNNSWQPPSGHGRGSGCGSGSRPGSTSSNNSRQPPSGHGQGSGSGSRPGSTSSNNSRQPPSGHGQGSGSSSGSRPGSTSSNNSRQPPSGHGQGSGSGSGSRPGSTSSTNSLLSNGGINNRPNSIQSRRYVRRPSSPVRPGNNVPNRLKEKGGFQMVCDYVKATTNKHDEVVSWLDEKYDPEAPLPEIMPIPKTGDFVETQLVTTTEKFAIAAATARNVIRAETEKGLRRSQFDFERDQRQEILASLYSHCDGDEPGVQKMPHQKKFLVVDFGTYRTADYAVMPAEFAIAKFNIAGGIQSCYSRMLDPKDIPFGYRCSVMEAMKKNGYMEPGFDPTFNWDTDCFQHIRLLMKENKSHGKEPGYLYVMPNDFRRVKECLLWIANGLKTEFKFKLMPFPVLVHILITEAIHLRTLNEMKVRHSSITEVECLKLLSSEEHFMDSSIACNFHQLSSRQHQVEFCCSTRVKGYIYNALKLLTMYYRCPRFEFSHHPKKNESEYTVEPVVQRPTADELNDDRSSICTPPSVASTSRYLERACGASTPDSISSAGSYYLSDSDDHYDELTSEDKIESRKRFTTYETFPEPTPEIREGRERRGVISEPPDFAVQPDFAARQLPSNVIPYHEHKGIQKDVFMPDCRNCRQEPCCCAGTGSASAYKRFSKPKNEEWNMLQKLPLTDRLEKTPQQCDRDRYSDDAASSISTVSTVSTRSGSEGPASPTPSGTGSFTLPDKVKMYDRVLEMKKWQKALPPHGSAGRGLSRWAGDRARVFAENLPRFVPPTKEELEKAEKEEKERAEKEKAAKEKEEEEIVNEGSVKASGSRDEKDLNEKDSATEGTAEETDDDTASAGGSTIGSYTGSRCGSYSGSSIGSSTGSSTGTYTGSTTESEYCGSSFSSDKSVDYGAGFPRNDEKTVKPIPTQQKRIVKKSKKTPGSGSSSGSDDEKVQKGGKKEKLTRSVPRNPRKSSAGYDEDDSDEAEIVKQKYNKLGRGRGMVPKKNSKEKTITSAADYTFSKPDSSQSSTRTCFVPPNVPLIVGSDSESGECSSPGVNHPGPSKPVVEDSSDVEYEFLSTPEVSDDEIDSVSTVATVDCAKGTPKMPKWP